MLKRCAYCMAAIREDEQVCPICGKEVDAEAPFHHLPVGTLLKDRYYIGAALGQGGFGITYAGYDTIEDRKVAVKEYYPNGFVTRSSTDSTVIVSGASEDDKAFFKKGKQRFLNEAHILSGFSGLEGVVDVHDCFEENNTVYIVMAFIEGVTLKQYLRSVEKIPTIDALNLMMPVMTTLEKIHQKGLIHRDISPDNIMLTQTENQLKVCLIDFGAARYVTLDNGRSLSVVLKHGFAPIEQYGSHGKQGPWTDVYALCATIYTCITGTVPDAAPDRVRSDNLKKPSEAGADIDAHTERVLMKGLARNDADRYRSIEAFLNALLSTEEPEQQDPSDTDLTMPAQEEKEDNGGGGTDDGYGSRRMKRVGALAAAATVVVIIAAVLLWHTLSNRMTTGADNTPSAKSGEQETTEEAMVAGECGRDADDSVIWSLSRSGTLTVSGSGRMKDCGEEGEELPPWSDHIADIKAVVVEKGVTELGDNAFRRHTALTSVSLPDSLTRISAGAFAGCAALTDVTMAEGIREIGASAFEGCSSLPSVRLPNSIDSIEDAAFMDCAALKDISVAGNAVLLGDKTFDNTAWYNAKPEGVILLGSVIYGYKGTIPENQQMNIHDDVKAIAAYAFRGQTGLVDIIFPDTVTVIGDGAFEGCAGLRRVSIPESATKLGKDFVPEDVTICGKAGSYAETWAAENNRAFEAL